MPTKFALSPPFPFFFPSSGVGKVAPGTAFTYDSNIYISHLSYIIGQRANGTSAVRWATDNYAVPLGLPSLFEYDEFGPDFSAGGVRQSFIFGVHFHFLTWFSAKRRVTCSNRAHGDHSCCVFLFWFWSIGCLRSDGTTNQHPRAR